MIAFAFAGTNSDQVLRKITHPGIEKHYLKSEMNYLEAFLDYLRMAEPDFILGMGQYSGRDKEYIRVEMLCRNKFRRAEINQGGKDEISIMPYFFMNDYFDLTQGMGNSWCNYISYKICSELEQHKFSFLHIPKTFSITLAAREIDEQLPRSELLLGSNVPIPM